MNKETRTLAEYIRDKLGLKVNVYCELAKIPYTTLRDQWKSNAGRVQVRNEVFRIFMLANRPETVIMFNEL